METIRCRELALFNLAVESKLRACDLVQLRARDVCHGQNMASRALILQQKTQRPESGRAQTTDAPLGGCYFRRWFCAYLADEKCRTTFAATRGDLSIRSRRHASISCEFHLVPELLAHVDRCSHGLERNR